MVYVSFSGGKDSTVLLDLVRRIYPDVPAVFCDTGLEYPEIRDFVSTIDNVTWLKPTRTFVDIITEYGYPIISKQLAATVEAARKNKPWAVIAINGLKSDGTESTYRSHFKNWKFLVDVDFKVSSKCCYHMKKGPARLYHIATGRKPFLGTMTSESQIRLDAWLKHGCNSYVKSKPLSTPIAFWTEQDIIKYIQKYNLNYCKEIYGDIVLQGNKLKFSKRDRTGCVFCGFGCTIYKHQNNFTKMAQDHPQLYDYCMRGGKFNEEGLWVPDKGLGMAKVLDAINIEWWIDEKARDKYRQEYKRKEKEQYNGTKPYNRPDDQ